jgi:hypothetical protein
MTRRVLEAKFGFGGRCNLLLALAAFAAIPAPAVALEVGAYVCRIEHAVLVTGQGETRDLESAPQEFVVSVFTSAPAREPLRDQPLRSLDYYYPEGDMPAARVEAKLFSEPATELRTEDGVVYAQQGNVFRFAQDGRFTATGHVTLGGEGIAVYSGYCERQ